MNEYKNKLSKTDLRDYYLCPVNLWRMKNQGFEKKPFTFEQKFYFEQGQKFELEARKFIDSSTVDTSVLVEGSDSKKISITEDLIAEDQPVIFQASVEVDGFITISDILIKSKDKNTWELYEIKSSNTIKEQNLSVKTYSNHIIDLAFQYNVMKMKGLNISKCFIVHPDKEFDYVPDNNNFFKIEDVTDKVLIQEELVLNKMFEMKQFLDKRDIGLGCGCLYKGRGNHCDSFNYSNPGVPDYSIFNLNGVGIKTKRLHELADSKVFDLSDLPKGDALITDSRESQYNSYISKEPIFDAKQIQLELSRLKPPIQFFDVETYHSAIPIINGYHPWEKIPFQWSLHSIKENGELESQDFLATSTDEDPILQLAHKLFGSLDPSGSIIVWNQSFEIGILRLISHRIPELKNKVDMALSNIFDLKPIFKKHYVDFRTMGSASLKAVTPVVLGDYTYDQLEINEGMKASIEWGRMVSPGIDEFEKEKIKNDLLAYCSQDTLATYKLLKFLQNLVIKNLSSV